jgi:hypothetical protein
MDSPMDFCYFVSTVFHQCFILICPIFTLLNVALSKYSFKSIFVVTDCVLAPPLPPSLRPKTGRQSSELWMRSSLVDEI